MLPPLFQFNHTVAKQWVLIMWYNYYANLTFCAIYVGPNTAIAPLMAPQFNMTTDPLNVHGFGTYLYVIRANLRAKYRQVRV